MPPGTRMARSRSTAGVIEAGSRCMMTVSQRTLVKLASAMPSRSGRRALLNSSCGCRLRAEGMGILLVEHDTDFVMTLTDRLVVMDFGTKLAEGPAADIRSNPAVSNLSL